MTLETEIKLIFDGRMLGRVGKDELIAGATEGPVRRRRLKSVYFDTEDRHLYRQGFTLRVRQDGRRFTQTIKAEAGTEKGLASREEWEAPVLGPEPELALAAETPVPGILRDAGLDANALRPLVAVEASRTIRMLVLDEGCGIEMAIDRGTIEAGGKRMALAEVELELKEGEPAALFRFARRLLRDIPFHLEFRPKSARGFALMDEPPRPEKAGGVDLDEEISIEAAFKRIASSCLRQMIVNEAPSLHGADAEGVHQFRVGLRRLRSAFSLFRKVLPAETEPLRGRLRDLMAAFGPAREWDVLLGETLLPLRARVADDPGLARLEKIAATARAEGHRRLREALAAPDYTDIKLALLELIAEDWTRFAVPPYPAPWTAPVGPFADRILTKRHKDLRRSGQNHHAMTLSELHELRIAAKKVRYAADFFRTLYRRRKVRAYVAALAGVQDCLGAINDGAVGRERIAEAYDRQGGPSRRSAGRARAQGAVDGWFAAVEHLELAAFAKAWERFLDTERFWRRPPKKPAG